MIDFTEYIAFFLLFLLLMGDQNDRLYWIYSIFSTSWLFDLLVVGQNDEVHWIYWFFSTFRLLTSCWEVKMFDFTEYIRVFWFFDFSTLGGTSKWSNLPNVLIFWTFRLFNLLLGGQTDQFYWILFDFVAFSTFRSLAGSPNWLITQYVLDFFDFSTFRPFSGRSKWMNLLNI